MCEKFHNVDDFERINQEDFSFGALPNLSVPENALERADRSVAISAAKLLPKMQRGKPLIHRFDVVLQYVEYDELEATLDPGETYRSASKNRLTKAITDVAATNGVNPSTIYDACTRGYEPPPATGESGNQNAGDPRLPLDKFRDHCEQIRECTE